MDGYADGGGDVDSEMRGLGLTVQDALTSEYSAYDASSRPVEGAREPHSVRVAFPRLNDRRVFLLDAVFDVLLRRDIGFWQSVYSLDLVLPDDSNDVPCLVAAS